MADYEKTHYNPVTGAVEPNMNLNSFPNPKKIRELFGCSDEEVSKTPMRDVLKMLVQELTAVETLEYHDKNLLSGNNKSRCEWKLRQLDKMRDILGRFEIENYPSQKT